VRAIARVPIPRAAKSTQRARMAIQAPVRPARHRWRSTRRSADVNRIVVSGSGHRRLCRDPIPPRVRHPGWVPNLRDTALAQSRLDVGTASVNWRDTKGPRSAGGGGGWDVRGLEGSRASGCRRGSGFRRRAGRCLSCPGLNRIRRERRWRLRERDGAAILSTLPKLELVHESLAGFPRGSLVDVTCAS
jgi:hypothetical protein